MEDIISSAIIDSYVAKLKDSLSLDAAIIGGGPSGLVAAETLAKLGYKVGLFERNISPGGGMWGGAMLFNKIVVPQNVSSILDEYSISYEKHKNEILVCDSIEATAALIYRAAKAKVAIFNGFTIEDVVFKNNRVNGVVVNWSTVQKLQWHVDPLAILAKVVVDATGHPSEITSLVAQKNDIKLETESGTVIGEGSLCAEEGEKQTVENTQRVYPGLYVAGMAAIAVYGKSRMGPIFGGMLLSGKKVANLINEELQK